MRIVEYFCSLLQWGSPLYLAYTGGQIVLSEDCNFLELIVLGAFSFPLVVYKGELVALKYTFLIVMEILAIFSLFCYY